MFSPHFYSLTMSLCNTVFLRFLSLLEYVRLPGLKDQIVQEIPDQKTKCCFDNRPYFNVATDYSF